MKTTITEVDRSTIIVSAGDIITNSPYSYDDVIRSTQQADLSAVQQDGNPIKPTIGIVTALPKEYIAVKALLEKQEEFVIQGRGAGRRYLLGDVPASSGGKHAVVLSLADMGTNIAATRATLLLEHFPSVTAIIMTGIAGGVPHPAKPDEHVRLGDIVVSNRQGVVQYDFDKEEIRRTIHRHPPAPPSATLLEGVRLLETTELEGQRPWLALIEQVVNHLGWFRPPEEKDYLTDSRQSEKIIPHPADPKRRKGQPRVFIGPIASANKLLKNPVKRDRLRDKFGVKAVEMEGSGVADATWNHEVGYLVVRGICDYCDANKGDEWQEYAAVVAAAYTITLLQKMPGQPQPDGTAKKAASSLARTTGNKNYSLRERFRPVADDDEVDDDATCWQPSVDLDRFFGEETDIRYLDPLLEDDEQLTTWREQLAIHRKNLRHLEAQKSKYTSLNVPAHIMNHINEEEAEIERLESLLQEK